MNIFQKRIENLCDEIVGRILALMQANSVSEVMLTDNDNPVFVIQMCIRDRYISHPRMVRICSTS